MAEGATYPARFTNSDGQTVLGLQIVYTDENNQPAGDSVPFVAPDGGAVTLVELANASPAVVYSADDAALEITGSETISGSLQVTGGATAAAANSPNNLPRLSQLTSALTIVDSTLPDLGAWVSGTAKVNPVTRQITAYVECAFDGTANAASVVIAISPDDTTYTTVGTPSVDAAVNTVGAITVTVPVTLPAGWFIKLTIATHAAVAPSIYY